MLKKSPQKVSIPTFLPRFFILDLSNNCILENRHGTSQAYTTNSDGEKINVRKLNTDSDEGRFISDSIINMKMENQYMRQKI